MVTWPLMCFITSVLNNDVLLFDSCHATNLLLLFAAQFWYYRATPCIFNGAISVKWLCSDRSTNTTLMHHHFEATLNFPVCLCSEENANRDSAANPFGECVFWFMNFVSLWRLLNAAPSDPYRASHLNAPLLHPLSLNLAFTEICRARVCLRKLSDVLQ